MTGDHFYTISDTELVLALEKYNYRDEGGAGYAFGIQIPGTTPLYRLIPLRVSLFKFKGSKASLHDEL